MEATGIPGGRLSSEGHRRRLLLMARARHPSQVVLIIGRNDLCGRDFDLPRLSEDLKLLGLGLEALGVGRVWILPILPRERTRVGDVSPERYEQRRVATNRIWATRFRRPPVTMVNMDYPMGTVGRDGVHMSMRGERVVLEVLSAIQV